MPSVPPSVPPPARRAFVAGAASVTSRRPSVLPVRAADAAKSVARQATSVTQSRFALPRMLFPALPPMFIPRGAVRPASLALQSSVALAAATALTVIVTARIRGFFGRRPVQHPPALTLHTQRVTRTANTEPRRQLLAKDLLSRHQNPSCARRSVDHAYEYFALTCL